MADLQTTYISDLEQGTIQDSTLFVTDNGENTNSATAADVVNFAKEKILPEANSYADTKKSEAVEESKEYVNGVISNENLLINWDFTNPINQRGQTEYIGQGTYSYTIDRWRTRGTAAVITVLSDAGGIQLAKSTTVSGYVIFEQIIDNSESLEGQMLTASAIINGELVTCTANSGWTYPTESSKGIANAYYGQISISLMAYSNKNLSVYIYIGGSVAMGTPYTLTSAKLEIGSISTLENSAPQNNDVELIKCYSFYQKTPLVNKYSGVGVTVAAYSTTRLEPLKIYPMRTTPTITIFNVSSPDYNEVGTITPTGFADKITGCTAAAYGVEYFIVRGSGFTVGTAYSFGYEADAEIYD